MILTFDQHGFIPRYYYLRKTPVYVLQRTSYSTGNEFLPYVLQMDDTQLSLMNLKRFSKDSQDDTSLRS